MHVSLGSCVPRGPNTNTFPPAFPHPQTRCSVWIIFWASQMIKNNLTRGTDAAPCLVGWSHGVAWWMCLSVAVSW